MQNHPQDSSKSKAESATRTDGRPLDSAPEQSDELSQPLTGKALVRGKHGIQYGQATIVRYATEKAEQSNEERLERYNADKAAFESALSTWESPYDQQLRDLLEASRFIDYEHQAALIIDAFRSRGAESILEANIPLLYNRNGSDADPEFQNARKINAFLKSSVAPPSVERLIAIHKIAMSGEVDELDKKFIGALRNYAVVGNEQENGLTKTELNRITKNPYLSFEPLEELNEEQRESGRHYGDIIYPEPMSVKDDALRRIRLSHPDVYEDIIAFKANDEEYKNAALNDETPEYQELTERLIRALLEERYEHLATERAKYENFKTYEDVLNYIKCVALHERDIISIHPFGDGNGRTVRYECLYDPLDKVGISRPRLNDPNTDILYSPSGWVSEVQRGILSTDALYRDMTERILDRLRIENSPELLFPRLMRDVGVHLKSRGRKTEHNNIALVPVDGKQFGAYLDTRLNLDPEIEERLREEPLQTMAELRDDYKAFVKSTLLFTHIPKTDVTQMTSLKLVDHDFRSVFGMPDAADAERWKMKLDRWYETDKLVWRGMCDEDNVLSNEELTKPFRQFDWITLDNYLGGYYDSPQSDLLEWLQEDFDRYNQDVVTGELASMVYDHVHEGARYDDSYGLSTSQEWGIACGFAWGRGRFGYDDKDVKAAQSQIQTRMVVGAHPAAKDVDVGKLKFLDPRFKSRSGFQKEIYTIGGIEPDAVMVAQRIDSRRRAIESFVRNPLQPNELWHVTGRFDPTMGALADLPKKRVKGIEQIY